MEEMTSIAYTIATNHWYLLTIKNYNVWHAQMRVLT